MAIVYSVAVRNNRLQQVINAIDAGVGNGFLKVGTAGMGIVVANITLAKPCATVAGGVLTFSGVPISVFALVNGVLAEAQLTDSAGTVVASGLTVGVAGTDIIVSVVAATVGDIVSFVSGQIIGQ